MHETAILLHTSNRDKKGTREGKKGAREGKKGAAPFYFGLAGTLCMRQMYQFTAVWTVFLATMALVYS